MDWGEQVGYRSGSQSDDYLVNSERGGIKISEINWAGGVRSTGDDAVRDPDVFIELLNKHGSVSPDWVGY